MTILSTSAIDSQLRDALPKKAFHERSQNRAVPSPLHKLYSMLCLFAMGTCMHSVGNVETHYIVNYS